MATQTAMNKLTRKQENKEMTEKFLAKYPITIGAIYRDYSITNDDLFVRIVNFTKSTVKLDVYEPQRFNMRQNDTHTLWDISPSYNNRYKKQITKSNDFIRCLHLCKMNETDVHTCQIYLH